MLFLLKSDNGWSAISPENRDPLFRITLKTWNSKGVWRPKRKPGQRTGHNLTRCGAIYSEIAKKQWVIVPISSGGDVFLARDYRISAGFPGYCRPQAR
jgi:hypothetical protein